MVKRKLDTIVDGIISFCVAWFCVILFALGSNKAARP